LASKALILSQRFGFTTLSSGGATVNFSTRAHGYQPRRLVYPWQPSDTQSPMPARLCLREIDPEKMIDGCQLLKISYLRTAFFVVELHFLQSDDDIAAISAEIERTPIGIVVIFDRPTRNQTRRA
jgi:hypothetical protein